MSRADDGWRDRTRAEADRDNDSNSHIDRDKHRYMDTHRCTDIRRLMDRERGSGKDIRRDIGSKRDGSISIVRMLDYSVRDYTNNHFFLSHSHIPQCSPVEDTATYAC